MKCEICEAEINFVFISVFQRDGSDVNIKVPLIECEEDAVYFETDPNWTGYELTEDEMNDDIHCPSCDKNPFKKQEIQVYDVVRVVKFKNPKEVKHERIK